MFCFHKKKKKKNTALFIFGIVIGVAAAVVGAYFLFTKVLKGKLFAKKTDECECDDECCCCCEETAADTAEAIETAEE